MTEPTEPQPEEFPVLYILMRTDLDSLNAGKAMAQAAHASNQMVKSIHAIRETPAKLAGGSRMKQLLEQWEKEGGGFGTTIVLDGDNIAQIEKTIESLDTHCQHHVRCGVVLDETYPIKDGFVTWYLPVKTCGWVFGDMNTLKPLLEGFVLHD